MSLLFVLLKSWMIGVAIAAPVGPIGMLCIRKTLELGLMGAILVGLGAALADSCYGLIAALGLSAFSYFLLENTVLLKIVGGMFLLFLAYREIKSGTPTTIIKSSSNMRIKLVGQIFFLTISNPMTILSFLGIFASISSGPTTPIDSLIMVVGIFLGSMTWWLALGAIIIKIKHKLPEAWLARIKYLSALILVGFAIVAIFPVTQ